jgi:hypothetical protein
MEIVKSKYRFLKNYIQSICFKYKSINDFDGLSPCVEYKNYIYKIGDVIEFSYNGGGLGMLPIKEKNIGLPMSYFEKVSDTTPLSKENISFGSKSLTGNSTLANTSSKPLSKVEPKLSKEIEEVSVKNNKNMSQVPFTPDPVAVDCAKKAGLPDWYVGDPTLMRPEVALDPKKEREYADCYRNKKLAPQKNKKYLLIAGALVLGYLAYKKFKK